MLKIEVDMIGMIIKDDELPITSCELITNQVSAIDNEHERE
jgi:hypothetical protein